MNLPETLIYLRRGRVCLFNMEIELGALGTFVSFVSVLGYPLRNCYKKCSQVEHLDSAHPGESTLKVVASVPAGERVATCSFTGGHLGRNHQLAACAGRDVH